MNHSEFKEPDVVLGPDSLRAIDSALDTLMPWLLESKYQIRPDGSIEFAHHEPREAIELLRHAIEQFLPSEMLMHLGKRSGLGWSVFFDQVVTWWLPQRTHVGFLRAYVNRARLHVVELKLHWNQGREMPIDFLVPPNSALTWGLVIGVIVSVILTREWYIDSIMATLVAASGLVAGRIYQRIVRIRVCGDHLCRARIGNGNTCSFCGAKMTRARTHG